MVDDRLKVCHHVAVNFDQELSEYKTKGGVYKSDDASNTVAAPVNMWLKALDMCFEKLRIDGLDFSTVLGVSGCAQQHGSVWWRRESSAALANLNPDEYLHKSLVSVFSLRDSPIWMDSSTTDECRMMEKLVGGPGRMAELTGSRAYERFTGPQIAKIFRRRKEAYLVTERITLISNFLASILCGSYAPFDASDASGMNMMDIKTKRWSEECLEAVVGGDKTEIPGLRMRLGCTRIKPSDPAADGDQQQQPQYDDNIVDSHQVVGHVSRYFVERYGFPPECLVSSFTGDNPGSMAGLCVGRDEVVLSLGTSDTAFFWLEHPHPGVNGHVLRNPIDESQYMGLICFKNGSKTRERIRDQCARGDWQEFSQLLQSVPRGNFGNIGFYFDLREIYPLCQGDFRYNKLDQRVESFESNELEVRACLEGQFLRLFHHSQSLGLQMSKIKRVLVTGGASSNKAILQVVADVFHSPVYTLELTNSACLGGAYLAKYAYELEQQKLDQLFQKSPEETTSAEQQQQHLEATSRPHNTLNTSATSEKQIDFTEMVLGSDEGESKLDLVRVAEPTPIGSSLGDVYKTLLQRYTKLETEMSLNNDETLSN